MPITNINVLTSEFVYKLDIDVCDGRSVRSVSTDTHQFLDKTDTDLSGMFPRKQINIDTLQ